LPCDFLYWTTDLNDPVGSIVSSDIIATVSPTTTTTYYAVVECEDQKQCVDEVIVTVDMSCGGPCDTPQPGSFNCNE